MSQLAAAHAPIDDDTYDLVGCGVAGQPKLDSLPTFFEFGPPLLLKIASSSLLLHSFAVISRLTGDLIRDELR